MHTDTDITAMRLIWIQVRFKNLMEKNILKMIKSESRINSRVLSIVLKHIRSRPSLESMGVKQYRAFLEKSASMFKIDKTVLYEQVNLDSVHSAWLTPPNFTDGKVVLYLHGGGFIAGSINSHRDLATRIAKASNARILIIDYKLAPENKFPAGLNDALNSYKWLLNNKISPHNIVVAGDSAGGGLALSLLLLIKEKGIAMPGGAVFLSPWVDLECKGKSYLRNKEKDPMLNHDMLYSTAMFYAENNDLSNPLLSPLNGDLSGLCPMLIQAGSNEVLEDDAVMLADKARQSGVKAELEIWDSMFHVWHYFARYLPEGRKAIERIGSFIATMRPI